jgi:hypothetical protein
MTTAMTITYLIVKEVCVNYLGTFPQFHRPSYAQIPLAASKNNATISHGYPVLDPVLNPSR